MFLQFMQLRSYPSFCTLMLNTDGQTGQKNTLFLLNNCAFVPFVFVQFQGKVEKLVERRQQNLKKYHTFFFKLTSDAIKFEPSSVVHCYCVWFDF